MSQMTPNYFVKSSYYCFIFFHRGYRAVSHGGALWGHYARLELFPDVNLGIYTTINGVEGVPGAMEPIRLFVGK